MRPKKKVKISGRDLRFHFGTQLGYLVLSTLKSLYPNRASSVWNFKRFSISKNTGPSYKLGQLRKRKCLKFEFLIRF